MYGSEIKNEKEENKDNNNNNNNSTIVKEGGLFGNIGKNDTIKQNEVKGNDKPKISLDGLLLLLSLLLFGLCFLSMLMCSIGDIQ